MKVSQKIIDVSQVMINSLKEGINLQRYYCFKPEEAKHILRIIDLFYTGKNYLSVSFFNNPEKDQTIAIKVFTRDLKYNNKANIEYLNNSDNVEEFLKGIKIGKTPNELRQLTACNF